MQYFVHFIQNITYPVASDKVPETPPIPTPEEVAHWQAKLDTFQRLKKCLVLVNFYLVFLLPFFPLFLLAVLRLN